jgi:tetratricopeptide (TPR) repeat protein
MALALAELLALRAPAQPEPEPVEVTTLEADIARLSRERRFDEAIPLAERLLSIQEKALGPDHPGIIKPLNDLALLYQATGDYTNAEALFERVLDITTAARGPRDPAVAVTVNNLGMLYWEQGDRARAVKFVEKALEIWQSSLGPDDPKVAVALENLAAIYRNSGDSERAEALYEKALAIWDKRSDPDTDQRLDALRALSAIRRDDGDYERAAALSQRVLEITEKARGAVDGETARALSDLASLVYASGDFARARPLLERALAIMQAVHGPDHPEVASALTNLAALDLATGDYASAEQRAARALEIREASFGPDHLATAAALENLASLYRAQAEYARAQPLCERALSIREKALGAEDLGVAEATGDLAAVHWGLGDFASAESLFERTLLIREKALGADHPVVAASVDNYASAQLVQGKSDRLQFLYEAALKIREKTLAGEDPEIAQSVRNLGLMYWRQGDWQRAESYLARSADIEQRQLSLLLPVAPRDRARALLRSISDTTNLILTFQEQRPDPQSSTRLAFTTVLRRKGRELGVEAGESVALQRRLAESDRSVLDPLLARRNELGRQILRAAGRLRSESLLAKDQRLRKQVDDLERAAASRGDALRPWTAPLQIDDLQAKIPPGVALIDLVEYRDLDPTRIAADLDAGTARLAAFVLRSEGEPRWVSLGDAAAIDASVRAFREALLDVGAPEPQLRSRARDLYDRIAAPLEPHLDGIRAVWVAPDGATTRVPFGALIGPDGRYWIERVEFAYLTSARDVLLADRVLPSQRTSLVLAAPDYDAASSAGEPSADDTEERRSPEIAALHFPPIAISETGASSVGRLLGVAPLTGARASAAEIRAARAPCVLHVAADGFFLPDQSQQPELRWGSVFGVETLLQPPIVESPLLRSGFAFAGANRRSDRASGELLTALQIAGLDLWGTQLVGIAAVGMKSDPAPIDRAVFAFRRAWALAGAQAQFANLWTTDSQVATELTTAYYERLLGGEGRSEALRSVQLEMLRSDSHSHPYYWAGFVSIGARGPIAWPNSRAVARPTPDAH